MIDSIKRSLERADGRHGGSRAAGDHQHRYAEQPCRLDLGIGSASAAVLGDDAIDQVLLQQPDFPGEIEGAAIEDADDVGRLQRRIDGIDATHQVEMLREPIGMMRLLPADRQEDAARRGAERRKRRRDIRHLMPLVANNWQPGLATESKKRDIGNLGRISGVGRDLPRKGMGGIDHHLDALGFEKVGETRTAAEAADADRRTLGERLLRPPGQRQQNVDAFVLRKLLRQQPSLGRAPQDQDAGLAHV